MRVWTFEVDQFEEELQKVKHVVIKSLYNEGSITKDVADDYSANRAIILRKPSFFSKAWAKIANREKDEIEYVLVRSMSFSWKEDGPNSIMESTSAPQAENAGSIPT